MLVALCSLKGSPGATTAALALAARWPAEQTPVVVECDPAGGDLAARFRLPSVPGLVSLAAAARKSMEASVLWQHVQRLPAGLTVIAGPVGAEQARAALGILAPRGASVLRAAGDQSGVVVLADCGRVDPDSPALPIIRASDAMVLFAHARDDELSHVASKIRTAATWNPRPGFVLVGGGYTTAEVEHELQIGVLGRLPHDPKGAAVLCGYSRTGPSPDRSALGRAALRLAHGLASSGRPHSAASAPPRVRGPVIDTGANQSRGQAATPLFPSQRQSSTNGTRP
ncbi:hypothetical protein A4R44_04080 [Amycolatopsis sp. M39]|nr:hypothetical protein A4R44_04080 [Amycolatopsis sp. M39]